MRRITESTDLLAPPESVFHIFQTPTLFVACRPGIKRFQLSTGAIWSPMTEFDVEGEFGGERYRAHGRITKLAKPCSFGFVIPRGLGSLEDYYEDYRMTFAGDSYTLMVNAQYNLARGLTVGMMDRFVFARRLSQELREVLENIARVALEHARTHAGESTEAEREP